MASRLTRQHQAASAAIPACGGDGCFHQGPAGRYLRGARVATPYDSTTEGTTRIQKPIAGRRPTGADAISR